MGAQKAEAGGFHGGETFRRRKRRVWSSAGGASETVIRSPTAASPRGLETRVRQVTRSLLASTV
jgi:hypothetical protein